MEVGLDRNLLVRPLGLYDPIFLHPEPPHLTMVGRSKPSVEPDPKVLLWVFDDKDSLEYLVGTVAFGRSTCDLT